MTPHDHATVWDNASYRLYLSGREKINDHPMLGNALLAAADLALEVSKAYAQMSKDAEK
jgi:hypothetical protein